MPTKRPHSFRWLRGHKKSIYERITIDEAKARLRDDTRQPPWDELDSYIEPVVRILWMEGVETIQSCQGGFGHSYAEPTVEFTGGFSAGFKALSICQGYDLRPSALQRFWNIEDGEPVGPYWALTFTLLDCPTWIWKDGLVRREWHWDLRGDRYE